MLTKNDPLAFPRKRIVRDESNLVSGSTLASMVRDRMLPVHPAIAYTTVEYLGEYDSLSLFGAKYNAPILHTVESPLLSTPNKPITYVQYTMLDGTVHMVYNLITDSARVVEMPREAYVKGSGYTADTRMILRDKHTNKQLFIGTKARCEWFINSRSHAREFRAKLRIEVIG